MTPDMEKKKVSKKALSSLINDSMRDAISHLQLPQPTKRVRKVLNKSSRKLATVFADILKKENKKARKAERKSLRAVDNKKTKKSKVKNAPVLAE